MTMDCLHDTPASDPDGYLIFWNPVGPPDVWQRQQPWPEGFIDYPEAAHDLFTAY